MVVMTQLAIDFSAPVRPRGSSAKGRAPGMPSSVEEKAGRDLPPEVYTRDEVQRLLDGPLGRNEKTRTRNRALLVVMWRAGLRVSEALDLRMEDLRSKDGGVWVRRGKGGKPRLAGMDPDSFEALQPWLELRAGLGLDPRGPVFCTFNGNAVQPSYVRHMCRRVRPGDSHRSRGIEGMGRVTMVGHDDPQEVPGAFQISRFSALASH